MNHEVQHCVTRLAAWMILIAWALRAIGQGLLRLALIYALVALTVLLWLH